MLTRWATRFFFRAYLSPTHPLYSDGSRSCALSRYHPSATDRNNALQNLTSRLFHEILKYGVVLFFLARVVVLLGDGPIYNIPVPRCPPFLIRPHLSSGPPSLYFSAPPTPQMPFVANVYLSRGLNEHPTFYHQFLKQGIGECGPFWGGGFAPEI